ncbi:MAG: Holliday junction branch migration protein RuvA [Lachnospiraceae bacterium]|nr:Holliday junction branch migration protein RuvA [Lachnospiraceae bacterium]
MISFLEGVLEDVDFDSAIVNVSGVGFRVLLGASSLSSLPSVGEKVRLYTHLQVREDGMTLFGFAGQEELSLFKKIIQVSGVGPKGGQAILSTMTPAEFLFCIASGDAKTIAKAPGIGKRTAERLILELKDKVNPEEVLTKFQGEAAALPPVAEGPVAEALQALVSLGYSQGEVSRALKGIDGAESMEVQELLQRAFQALI